jgi:hypothetical protein
MVSDVPVMFYQVEASISITFESPKIIKDSKPSGHWFQREGTQRIIWQNDG